jgi:uncharacterized protein (TIGR02996 family)
LAVTALAEPGTWPVADTIVPMPTPSELYEAILADPDNVDLRLRYADAVAPQDSDHAELIRLDVEKERLGRQALHAPPEQAKRRRQLSRAIGPRIAAGVAPLVYGWQLRRGFPELVEMSAADFLDHGAEVFRRAPVRHLALTGVAGHLDALIASPLLGRLSSLELSDNPLGDDGVETLLRSPHLGNIRLLGLSRTGVGPRGAEALAATSALPQLRYVNFVGNPVEVAARPAGEDAIDGRVLDVEYPEFGRLLMDRYGKLPWLTYTSPNPANDLYWPPDFGEV